MRRALFLALAASRAGAASFDLDALYPYALSEGRAIAAASDGTAVVTGTYQATVASVTGPRGGVWRLEPLGGLPVWSRSFTGGGATNYEQTGTGVALAPGGDVVVAGLVTTGTTTGNDLWLARYDFNDGATVWEVQRDGGLGLEDRANAVAVAASGEIFVAGRRETAPGDPDAWIARFSAAGAFLGEVTYQAAFGGTEEALAIAVDASGSVYVAGSVMIPGSVTNAWVSKFAPDLSVQLWSRSLNGAVSSTDYYAGVAVDPAGTMVFAAGATAGATTYLDVLITRFDAGTGDPAWTLTRDGGEGDEDRAFACALTPAGDLVVAGALDQPTYTFTDAWAAAYAPDGSGTRWEIVRSYLNDYRDEARGVSVDPLGVPRLTGVVRGMQTPRTSDPRLWIAAVDPAPPPIAAPPVPAPGVYASPNPFRPGSGGANDATGITVRGVPAGATVRFYTPAGRKVAEAVDADRDGAAFWNAAGDDGNPVASGTYLWFADGGSAGTARGKVVIVR